MDFKQGNDGVYIHAAVSSSGESLYRICLPQHKNRPKIYMVEGFSDCSAITSQETVNAKLIATLDNPSKCAIINLWYFFCTQQTDETWKVYNLNRVIPERIFLLKVCTLYLLNENRDHPKTKIFLQSSKDWVLYL